MAVTVTPSLLVQLAVQRLPIGVQPGRSPCALLEVRVPGSEMGRFVPLLPSSCQPISATRWQTRDHDGNKILLQTNSVPVQLGPEPWLSLPVDGADGDTICSLPTSPTPTPSLRPNCQSLPASPGPSLPCCSPALSPTHSPTRSPEQNTPCRCRPHSYISVSTHQSPPQSPTRNFISQKSSLSPPYQSLPHHSSNRAQLFSAHRRHHCSLTANRPTSPRLSSTYGASHPSKQLQDPSTKRPSRQIISHLSCHGQPSANGQQQMENRTESRDKAPPSQQSGQAAGHNVLAENTLKEGQKEAEEQEFFI
uniref:FAM124 domain-containing protein n=1 Tax=Eptatretus burgeri TaxID=7764 RepID=A0A8C4QMZ0_EPTBU